MKLKVTVPRPEKLDELRKKITRFEGLNEGLEKAAEQLKTQLLAELDSISEEPDTIANIKKNISLTRDANHNPQVKICSKEAFDLEFGSTNQIEQPWITQAQIKTEPLIKSIMSEVVQSTFKNLKR